jgi:hypothetical protein
MSIFLGTNDVHDMFHAERCGAHDQAVDFRLG